MRYLTDKELCQIKEISLDMLKYFDVFCKENNLNYIISCGTALGAVRHKGFIPWDDDVDVDMPIEDYHKLYKIWLKNGDKEKYFLQTKKTDPDLGYPFYRLRLNGTTWSDIECKDIPIHWGIPIDIFPVFHAPKSMRLRKIQHRVRNFGERFSVYGYINPQAHILLKWLYKEATIFMYWIVYIISKFSKKSGIAYAPNDMPVGNNNNMYQSNNLRFPSKPITFENAQLQGPSDPDAYLTWKYNDYKTLPPEEKRQRHAVVVFDLNNDSEKYTGVRRRNK